MSYSEIDRLLEQALAQHKRGDLNGAAALYHRVLDADPNNPNALHYYGLLQHQQGDNTSALESLRKAAAISRSNATIRFNTGVVLQAEGRLEEAAAQYEASIAINPHFAMAHNNLGSVHEKRGDFENAGRHYRKALKLDPKCVEALNNQGNVFKMAHRLADAADAYAKALAANPNYAEAYNNLGTVFEQRGRLAEAEEHYRNALRIRPNFTSAHSNLLFCLNYQSDRAPADVFAEHVRYAEQQTANISPFDHAYTKLARRQDKLRIGYVSGDFRTHSVAYFIEPVLSHHDRERFEIFCYANVGKPDAITERLKKQADHWRDIYPLTDERAAHRICNDNIDILVDLAGHTAGNRLPLFARRAAPIQVTYLGYPNTTGLPEIDYRITDTWADPPGASDHLHSERLLRLGDGFLCYQPPEACPPVAKPPALQNGYITFGSFNNLAKVTPDVIRVWSAILQRTPGARLLLKSKALCDEATRQALSRMFRENGIGEERIELLGHIREVSSHLQVYQRVDIGLDPFPYNGTTTTCEALWMGVPVITLAGQTHAARVGLSLLSNLRLNEFAADSPDGYIETAVELAGDQQRLRKLRAGLRDRMSEATLMDAGGFTAKLEKAYGDIWADFIKN